MSRPVYFLGHVVILFLVVITSPLAAAQPQVLFSSYPSTVIEGNSYPIVWGINGLDSSNADPTVRINLWKGPTDNLSKIIQLDQYTTTGGIETYQWNVSISLTPANDYALEIVLEDGTSPDYSSQISILAAGTTGTATAQSTVTGVVNRPSSSSTSHAAAAATTSASPGSSSSHGLSGGAIAGIVIGCLAGVTLVLLAAFFFLRQRRNTQRHPVYRDAEVKESFPVEVDASTESSRLELGGREIPISEKPEKDGFYFR